MKFLKFILVCLSASFSMSCFGQDCFLTDEIEAKNPTNDSTCYEYMYIPDLYETVKEIEVRKAPNVPKEVEWYEEYTITRRVLVKEGYCGWLEVVCKEYETPKLYDQIKDALRKRGYYGGYPLRHFLSKLQKDFGLPIGNLNIETLRALGTDYKQLGTEK